jgi:hypothetical protein
MKKPCKKCAERRAALAAAAKQVLAKLQKPKGTK